MDQVLGFLFDRMASFRSDPTDKIMTKTMVNNYVKAKLLPTPIKKKYGVDHIKKLIMIYHFKNVISIKEINQLLNLLDKEQDNYDPYDLFLALQKEEIETLKLNKALTPKEDEDEFISTIRFLIRSDLCSRMAQVLLNNIEDN